MSSHPFRAGDTIVWEPNFNPGWWNTVSEEERLRMYGSLGYGQNKPVLFTFLCEHHPQTGHCVLVNMDTQQIETMRHTCEFRLAEDDEC